jgi:hypothetical protein
MFTKEELNVLISGLNALTSHEEKRLTRDYGSVSALYNKIYSQYEQLNQQSVN